GPTGGAARHHELASFTDPERVTRFPAFDIGAIHADAVCFEENAAYEIVKAREIALVLDANYTAIRRRLKREGIHRKEPSWEQVRGKWNLPSTLIDFRHILKATLAVLKAPPAAARAKQRQQTAREPDRR